MRLLRCGRRAALVELDDLAAVLGLYAALQRQLPEGVNELVPAARTLLVGYDPARTDLNRLGALLDSLPALPPEPGGEQQVQVRVRYDGEDLTEVAGLTGLSERAVVERHVAGGYTCAFCGFSAGFAYLTGLDPVLHVARRDTPRTKVPAGAVAIADEFSAVYPRDSPGGWRILGHTDDAVWDLGRDPPTLLAPGTRVSFVEAGR